MSKLQEQSTQQANQAGQVASLPDKDQQLAEIIEEEMHTEKRCQFFPVCTSSRQRKERPRARRSDTYWLLLNNSRNP